MVSEVYEHVDIDARRLPGTCFRSSGNGKTITRAGLPKPGFGLLFYGALSTGRPIDGQTSPNPINL
jgi:hypothetical protein